MPLEGQSAFATALLQPDAPLPDGVVDPKGKPAPKRFAVYQNNVIVSLTEALAASFPAVSALVGEEFFKQMALLFVREQPPQSPLIAEYGREFSVFVASFEPAKGLPFLGDVARLDRAWLDSFHATDSVALDPARLGEIDQDALFEARFEFSPATHLVSSVFPVVDIWNAGRSGEAAAGLDPTKAQSALVTRPDVSVSVVALDPAQGVFFKSLFDGATLGDAAEQAMAENAQFDLAGALGMLISTGAAHGINI